MGTFGFLFFVRPVADSGEQCDRARASATCRCRHSRQIGASGGSASNRSNRIAFDRLLDVIVVVLRMWCRARSNRLSARANRARHAAAMRTIASSIWADLPISTILFHMELPVDARHNSKIRRAGVLAWVLRNLR